MRRSCGAAGVGPLLATGDFARETFCGSVATREEA